MKNLFLPVFLLIAITSTQAQECNKYLESEVEDNFVTTGAVYSKRAVFSQPTVLDTRTASFRVLDGNRFYFHLTSGNGKDLIYGSDVILTFSNGEDLTLRIEQMDRVKEGSESVSHANCRIYTREHAELFYSHRITKINLVGMRQTFDIGEKTQEKIKHGAICIVEKVEYDNMNFDSERRTKLIPDMSGVSFDVGSSSMIIMSGSVKCEFEKDSIDANGSAYKLSKPKDIVTSPYALKAQIAVVSGKTYLYLTYSKDLGNINKDSYLIFRFKDGSTKEFKHSGEFDTKENPTFMVDVTTYKDIFWNNELTMIRLSYSEYYADLAVANPTYVGSFLKYCFQ